MTNWDENGLAYGTSHTEHTEMSDLPNCLNYSFTLTILLPNLNPLFYSNHINIYITIYIYRYILSILDNMDQLIGGWIYQQVRGGR